MYMGKISDMIKS